MTYIVAKASHGSLSYAHLLDIEDNRMCKTLSLCAACCNMQSALEVRGVRIGALAAVVDSRPERFSRSSDGLCGSCSIRMPIYDLHLRRCKSFAHESIVLWISSKLNHANLGAATVFVDDPSSVDRLAGR